MFPRSTAIILAFLSLASPAGAAAVSLYSQNFDGMIPTIGTFTNSTSALPTGWKFESGTSPSFGSVNATSAVTQNAGTSGTSHVLTSSVSGGDYLFVNGNLASGTDKGIGFITTGAYSSPRSIMFQYTNNTGSGISSFNASWDYEKYRSGSRAIDWTFFSSTDGTNWTAVTAGDKSYSGDANNSTVFNPPSTDSKSGIAIATSVANGASLYLRWTYTGSGGSTNGQALGIDNFSLTGVPAPVIPAPGALALLGAAGLLGRRRRG
jgi:MYXO-CTERM domain-containing protein